MEYVNLLGILGAYQDINNKFLIKNKYFLTYLVNKFAYEINKEEFVADGYINDLGINFYLKNVLLVSNLYKDMIKKHIDYLLIDEQLNKALPDKKVNKL